MVVIVNTMGLLTMMEPNGMPLMDVMIVIVKTEMLFAQRKPVQHVSTKVRNIILELNSLLQMDVIHVIVTQIMAYIAQKIYVILLQFVILLVVLIKNAVAVVMDRPSVPLVCPVLHWIALIKK
jgi:hypothetical protein